MTANSTLTPFFEFHLLELYFPVKKTEVLPDRSKGQCVSLLFWQVQQQPHVSGIIQVEGTWARRLGRPVCDPPRGPCPVRQSPGPTHTFLPSTQESHADFLNKPSFVGTSLVCSGRSGVLKLFFCS